MIDVFGVIKVFQDKAQVIKMIVQDKYIRTLPSILALQDGHLVTAVAHSPQQFAWRQGRKSISMSLVQQILHRDWSDEDGCDDSKFEAKDAKALPTDDKSRDFVDVPVTTSFDFSLVFDASSKVSEFKGDDDGLTALSL